MKTEMLYLDGNFMPLDQGRLHVEDRGFQLGDGVYEVIKVLNGRLVWAEDHLDRLARSLREIRLPEVARSHGLDSALPELVRLSGEEEAMVYVQVTRGPAPREFVFPSASHPTVLAYVRAKPPLTAEEILRGSVLHPVEDLRWSRCDIKCIDLLAPVLAKEEAKEAGADEALFLGPDGLVREGGSSNIFAFLDEVLLTHPLDNHILGGVTRKHVLVAAARLGMAVEERAFTLQDLYEASSRGCEVFLTSTLRSVYPVVRVGAHVIGSGRPGKVTLALLDAVAREQALYVGLPEPPHSLHNR